MTWIKQFSKLKSGFLNPFTFFEREFNYGEAQSWKDQTKIDQSFIRLAFLLHFMMYSTFAISEVRNSERGILYLGVIFLVNVMSLVLSFQEKFLSWVIHISNTVIIFFMMNLFHESFYGFQDLENLQIYNNYFLLISLIVIFQMFRLKKSSCLLTGMISICLHIIFVSIKRMELGLEDFPIILFVPDVVYGLCIVIGTSSVNIVKRLISISSELDLEYKYIQQDLTVAKQVQENLFPGRLSIKGIRYEVMRITPNHIGGDFFDFVQLREGNTGIFLTDVAGHGIASALVASMVKIMVSTMPYILKVHPSRLMDYIDDSLNEQFHSYHASAIYMFLDFISREVTFSNAGHPYLIRGSFEKEFHEVETEGAILGFGIKKPIAEQVKLPLVAQDRFFLYTDGLIENKNREGKLLGTEGLLEILNGNRFEKDLGVFKANVQKAVENFFGNVALEDDTLFLIVEVE
ncbi:PP2C family protein-serine/threonine phosphatase [Leptospira borgpetersenii]|uniref:SpoIIE-like protein phosphatase domain protein n=1 Tax=Leptospira borgpetersenii serovar Javanica str. UI 09931 TaxID=1049767 RepID=A0AAV3JGA5_LEPBO|nr:PP2C family protein-serine/threonine phosphatase [Leptospira borgpetersenii]AXX15344.1 serine/threonine-protein phosphatase [Leptospira borgpetersenii serovar Ceylonica]EKQ91315.1 stage II sporulation protein E [Leptospira borgpetersenii str. UI 09149]EMN59043.1 stage II sporulation protein E [Leptospira borgpetersenii serovar Javanica str. MK146]EPG59843.1 SpoIIE-like protein phosphatase domain protein [Leptospira borgpetersenii serovar Javanica str. UI 09931]MDQ7245508.1 PP2C family prote